jgi:hypothetical protein
LLADEHVMKQTDTISTWYPPHPPRTASDVYVKSHHLLTVAQNTPCWACGIRYSDIAGATTPNIAKGMAMETHHFWCEDAFTGEGGGQGGIWWPRIMADHPAFDWPGSGFVLADPKTWKFFVDSVFNLQVLCSSCHRASAPVLHWRAGLPDPDRGGLVWTPDAANIGIHHASYPEYRDQRHARPDEPPFRVMPSAVGQPPPPVPPQVIHTDQGGADALASRPMQGHTVVGPDGAVIE